MPPPRNSGGSSNLFNAQDFDPDMIAVPARLGNVRTRTPLLPAIRLDGLRQLSRQHACWNRDLGDFSRLQFLQMRPVDGLEVDAGSPILHWLGRNIPLGTRRLGRHKFLTVLINDLVPRASRLQQINRLAD